MPQTMPQHVFSCPNYARVRFVQNARTPERSIQHQPLNSSIRNFKVRTISETISPYRHGVIVRSGGSGYRGKNHTPLMRKTKTQTKTQTKTKPLKDIAGESWQWRGHAINYTKSGSGPPVILIHGFGAMLGHYRKTSPALAKDHTVYAIDLLGFGASAKPAGFAYSMEGWRDMIGQFMAEVAKEPVVIVGNSIGSLIALLVAADPNSQSQVRGVVILNCAGGMNSKFILELEDWRWKLFTPLFALIDLVLKTDWILRPLFEKLSRRESIASVLANVYVNGDAVDDELVEMFYTPSLDANASATFVNILTGPPGPPPAAVLQSVKCPVQVVWGRQDTVTALQGPVGKLFAELDASPREQYPPVQMSLVDAGHCPQDDCANEVNTIILDFLQQLTISGI